MTRVTPSEVRDIIDLDGTSDSELQSIIEDANVIIDNRIAGQADAEILTMMEKWLSAHFASIKEPNKTSEAVGDQEYEYESPRMGQGLKSTRYGQQVIDLDPSGTMGTNPHHTVAKHNESEDRDLDPRDSPNFG